MDLGAGAVAAIELLIREQLELAGLAPRRVGARDRVGLQQVAEPELPEGAAGERVAPRPRLLRAEVVSSSMPDV